MKTYIERLKNNEDLSIPEIEEVMKLIMSGQAPKDDIAAFLLALREKGATVDEITGAAMIMRECVVPVIAQQAVIVDTCGTGGDKKGTFNVSTVVALAVAGAGVTVAKHGNRSVSSQCGSADVLEALGVNIHLNAQQLSQCLERVGIAFLFAQGLHPAMRHVAPARRELGVETIFNILGPLTNPARATHQMMGVYSPSLLEPLAHVLKNLGLKKALVVHGGDGLDEITTTAETQVSEFDGEAIRSYSIAPEDFKFKRAAESDLKGGTLQENTAIAREILAGKRSAKRDIVLMNAGHALYIAEAAKTAADGIRLAAKSIDSGKALEKLDALIAFTNAA